MSKGNLDGGVRDVFDGSSTLSLVGGLSCLNFRRQWTFVLSSMPLRPSQSGRGTLH